MKLYVEPMDAIVVDVDRDGRVMYETAGPDGQEPVGDTWSTPTLQERRAIIYAARSEMSALTELVDILENLQP